MDKSSAKKGDTVTITVTPDAGYELGKLTVTDAKGNTIATTKKDDNKYTFTMPDGKVTVTPTFTKIAEEKPSANAITLTLLLPHGTLTLLSMLPTRV